MSFHQLFQTGKLVTALAFLKCVFQQSFLFKTGRWKQKLVLEGLIK